MKTLTVSGIIFVIALMMIFSALPQNAFAGPGDVTVQVTVFDKNNTSKHKSGAFCIAETVSTPSKFLDSGTTNNGGKVRLTFASGVPATVIVTCDGVKSPQVLIEKKMTRIQMLA